jgi:AcrR family transcriptional regulator
VPQMSGGVGRDVNGHAAVVAAPPRRRPGRPANTNSDDTRLRILEVGVEAFAEGGYAAVSMRAVSERAGVTPATVYHHFPTKRVLYIATYRHAINVAFAHYTAAIGHQSSLVDELREMLQCSLRIMRARPAISELAVRAYTELTDPELEPLAGTRAARDLLDGIVERAIGRGELDPANAVSLLRMLEVFLWGLSILGRDNDRTRQECVDALDALLVGRLLLPGTGDGAAPARLDHEQGVP